jgi:HNH endonuclease
MTYERTCQQMHAAGWLSHELAACNTVYGRGKAPRLDVTLRRTQTYHAFTKGQTAPGFDDARGVAGALHYRDKEGAHADAVLVDAAAGLVLRVHPEDGQRLVGFLSDVPGENLQLATVPPPPVPPVLVPPVLVMPPEPAAVAAPFTPIATDIDGSVPGRVATTIYRILRDTELARRVKSLHNFRCQLCGGTMTLPDGVRYAEAHHIRPLGQPHDGPDTLENILCLCPNHHAALDYRAMPIDLAKLTIVDGHRLAPEHIDYYNRLMANGHGA